MINKSTVIMIQCPAIETYHHGRSIDEEQMVMKTVAVTQFSSMLNTQLKKMKIDIPESNIMRHSLSNGVVFSIKSKAIQCGYYDTTIEVVIGINPITFEAVRMKQYNIGVVVENKYKKASLIVVEQMKKLPLMSIVYKYVLDIHTGVLAEHKHIIHGGFGGYIPLLKTQVEEYENINPCLPTNLFSKKRLSKKKQADFRNDMIKLLIKEKEDLLLYYDRSIKETNKDISKFGGMLE